MSNPAAPHSGASIRPLPLQRRDSPRPALSVPPSERSEWLDALRGFALLGILLYNIEVFGGYVFRGLLPPMQRIGDALDPGLDFMAQLLIQGKFYSLFSFLFGLGFALQMQRARAMGVDGSALLRRRLSWLLVFGLAHAMLVWFGDILVVYAVLGFCLLAAWRLSQRALLVVALCLLASPIAFYLVFILAGIGNPLATGPSVPPDQNPVRMIVAAIAHGSYAEVVQAQVALYPAGWLRRAASFALPRILGMFLLGVWAARAGLPQVDAQRAAMLRAWLGCGVAIGLPLNLAFALLGGNDALYPAGLEGMLVLALATVGVPLLCLGYVAAFALYWRRTRPGHLLVVAGRTALSQYLGQSIVCVALFYGFGLGMFGRFSYAGLLLVGCGVYLSLALAAKAWLRVFPQGPAEMLWRRLSQRAARSATPAGEPA